MKTLKQFNEAYKVGAKVIANGKKGVVQARGGDYYDVHHEDGTMESHHVSKVKPLTEAKEEPVDRIEAGRKYLQHAQEHARYANAEKTAANKKEAAYHKRAMEKYAKRMEEDKDVHESRNEGADEQNAYDDGHMSFVQKRAKKGDNPHPPGSNNHKAWESGRQRADREMRTGE